MKFDLFINVTLRDRNGKVIKRIRRKANSYVRGMMDLLRQHMAAAATGFVDVGGTDRTSAPGWAGTFTANAAAGNSAYGIRVGTSTTTVLITNYNLWSMIAHGSGSGQLDYGACGVGVLSTVGTSRRFTVTRTFTNNSGASITVQEVGLVVMVQDDGAVTRYAMIDRSLVTFSIPNGAAATVTYTISVTV